MKIINAEIYGNSMIDKKPVTAICMDDVLEEAGYHAGDTIWAVIFLLNDYKNDIELRCEPTPGVLSWTKCEQYPIDEKDSPEYFIPYGADNKLQYKKAISVDNMCFATSEHDAKELYEELVKNAIEEVKEHINELTVFKDRLAHAINTEQR